MLQRILLLPLLSPLLAVLLVAAINPKRAVSVRATTKGVTCGMVFRRVGTHHCASVIRS